MDQQASQKAGEEFRAVLLHGVPDKRGILKKRGGFCLGLDVLKSVRERWCELRGPTLTYYRSMGESAAGAAPKGEYLIDDASTVTPVQDPRFESPFVFVLRCQNTLPPGEAFAASSQSELGEWIAAIEQVVETLKRFPAKVA